MSLYIVDKYPSINEASGIPQNATLWAQFNKALSLSTVSYITVSVACPGDGYIPVDGDVALVASATGAASTLIKFTADQGYDPYKRYSFNIQGGVNGVKGYDGDIMQSNFTLNFTTNDTTITNEDIPATGVPEASGYIPTENLRVIDTYPNMYDTDISKDISYIKIKFNDSIPSGTNLYDYIKITNKDI